jgi:hypothetical protein
MKRTLIGIAVLALVLGAPVGVAAGRGESVDPDLMQPPLNASFGPWECWRTGTGITCEGHRTLHNVGETGLICDGRMVYVDEVDERSQRRYGDTNGLALKTISHVDIRGTLGLEPDLSGPNLFGGGIYQETFEYAVPGDLSTRTSRITGWDTRITAPGVGLILHDVGVKTYDIEDTLLFAKGPHPVADDFESAFARLCVAFEEIGA